MRNACLTPVLILGLLWPALLWPVPWPAGQAQAQTVAQTVAQAGLPPAKGALRDLERAGKSGDAAALPRLRSEADRLRRQLDDLGPAAGGDRTRLNRLERDLNRRGDLEPDAQPLPEPYPRRSRIVTPALPQTDLDLDDLPQAE